LILHFVISKIMIRIVVLEDSERSPLLGWRQKRAKSKAPKETNPYLFALPPAKSYQPSSFPQLFHILSTILSFSDRLSSGPSRSSISSKNPSRSRDRAGSDVKPYSRRCARERTNSPVVKAGILSGCTVSELRWRCNDDLG
jgi:hypothetical protein